MTDLKGLELKWFSNHSSGAPLPTKVKFNINVNVPDNQFFEKILDIGHWIY